MNLWSLLKDILLTGTGMALIISQVFSSAPQEILLVTGLALTVPSVAAHAGSLLTGHPEATGGPSLPPSPPPGPPPSPPSPAEATRE